MQSGTRIPSGFVPPPLSGSGWPVSPFLLPPPVVFRLCHCCITFRREPKKSIPLHYTVAQNSGFFFHQPYHFTHKSISNYCLFKKNLVTAASLLFCFCHSRSLGDRELRDVNKTGIHRIYLLPPPLPFLPHKRSIQIFCCEAWREKAFPDTLLGFGNLECCKNTCVGKKTKEIVQNDAQKKWERNNIF